MAASPRILLALKVLAHRVGEDEDDVALLAHELGLGTAAAVLAVAEDTFGDRLDAAARFFVEGLLASRPWSWSRPGAVCSSAHARSQPACDAVAPA